MTEQSPPLPVAIDEITTDWLTEVLSINYPGVVVTSARIDNVLWGTGTKVRVEVEYNSAGVAANLPRALFVKGGFSEHRELMEDCYRLEVRFYRDILPELGLNAPRAYFAGSDPARKQHIVIMEDMNLRKVSFCRVQKPLNFGQAAAHLDIIANLHARWWQSPEFEPGGALADLRIWEPLPSDEPDAYAWGQLRPDVWEKFMTLPRGIAVPRFIHDRDRMEEALIELGRFSQREPHCFLHADYHLGNLYFDADGTPGTLDWQSFRRGHWSHDVTYFMVSSLDIADRRNWDRALLAYYLERLGHHGVRDVPDFDSAYEAFRRQIVDGLYFWLVNPVEFQVEENNCAVAPRFAMAALDHGTFEALLGP